MATIEVKRTWCDQHLHQEIEEPGTPRPELKALLGITPDLCDPCYKELTARLFQLVESVQQEIGPKSAEVDPYVDPAKRKRMGPKYSGRRQFVCPLDGTDYGSISGWRRHMETEHGVVDASFSEVYGHVCPLDGEDMGTGRQSATMHARDRHRINNVTRLFERAAKRGDKYGVVASRLEALWV